MRFRRVTTLTRRGAVLAAFALSLVACGNAGSGTGVASVGTGTASPSASSTAGTGDPLKYSQCMRTNGVPKFPDPQQGGGIAIDAGSGVDPDSAAFKKAEKACEKYRPTGGPTDDKNIAEMQKQMLAYSKCMRENGFPKFPDPKFEKNKVSQTLPRSINPNTPQFKKADELCRKKTMPNAPKPGKAPANGGPNGGGKNG